MSYHIHFFKNLGLLSQPLILFLACNYKEYNLENDRNNKEKSNINP